MAPISPRRRVDVDAFKRSWSPRRRPAERGPPGRPGRRKPSDERMPDQRHRQSGDDLCALPDERSEIAIVSDRRSGEVSHRVHAAAEGLSDDQRLHVPAQPVRIKSAERDVHAVHGIACVSDRGRTNVPADARAQVLSDAGLRVRQYASPRVREHSPAGVSADRPRPVPSAQRRAAVPAQRRSRYGAASAPAADRGLQAVRQLRAAFHGASRQTPRGSFSAGSKERSRADAP